MKRPYGRNEPGDDRISVVRIGQGSTMALSEQRSSNLGRKIRSDDTYD